MVAVASWEVCYDTLGDNHRILTDWLDLVFNGGKYGIWVGNQQFTVRNITVNKAQTAIFGLWNWGK